MNRKTFQHSVETLCSLIFFCITHCWTGQTKVCPTLTDYFSREMLILYSISSTDYLFQKNKVIYSILFHFHFKINTWAPESLVHKTHLDVIRGTHMTRCCQDLRRDWHSLCHTYTSRHIIRYIINYKLNLRNPILAYYFAMGSLFCRSFLDILESYVTSL